jgi:hypothetical protein
MKIICKAWNFILGSFARSFAAVFICHLGLVWNHRELVLFKWARATHYGSASLRQKYEKQSKVSVVEILQALADSVWF